MVSLGVLNRKPLTLSYTDKEPGSFDRLMMASSVEPYLRTL
jgi:hypothetical protein